MNVPPANTGGKVERIRPLLGELPMGSGGKWMISMQWSVGVTTWPAAPGAGNAKAAARTANTAKTLVLRTARAT